MDGVSAKAIDEGVRKLFTSIERAISEPALYAWLTNVADGYVKGRARERFASEGDRVSGKWQPLAPSTIEDRIRHGFPEGPILHRTGSLEDYVTNSAPQASAFAGGVQMQAPGPTSDPEMQMKMYTAQKGNKKVPKREVIGMDVEDAATLTGLLSVSLHEIISRGL